MHYECVDCTDVTLNGSPPDETDDYGAVWELAVSDPSQAVTVTISDGGVVDVDGASFTPADVPTAWFRTGDQTVYPSRGAAEDYATIHYHRPAGDYGDATSSDFTEFWGLHVWTGAATETVWTDPLRPVGQDVFGIEFRISLVDGADQLAYIIHRGDTKDPGPDQFLVFATFGHEVWQVEGADPENPYVAPLRS